MDKKIVTITGHKKTNKDIVAKKLAKNSAVGFVTPYTDREIPKWEIPEKYGDYHYVLPTTLDKMIEEEEVLTMRKINGNRYVIFAFQLTEPYNVLIVDDYQLIDIRDKWKGQLYSIFVTSPNEEKSGRVEEYLYRHEDVYDEIFNYETDDFDELEWRVG